MLLEELSGVRLSQRPPLEDPPKTLGEILRSMRLAYARAHLVNADLSEYNVLTDGGSVWLIDWPQAIDASHPNSGELLRHDVNAITAFFRRAYDAELDQEKAFDYVTGRTEQLE